MRIAFFGTQEFAVPTLEALSEKHQVVAVVTQPARPKGRGLKLEQTPVELAALAADLPVLTPENPNDPMFLSVLAVRQPELAVLVAYGCILHKALLSLPARGFLNLHPSLLPKYRGAAPIQRSIMAGDTTTGVSVIGLARKVDAGPILLQKELPIAPAENSAELSDHLARLGAELMLEAVDLISTGKAEFRAQDESLATSAPKLVDEERKVDWHKPRQSIHNLVRAFAPRPAAFADFRSERVLLLRTRPVPGPARSPGAIELDQPGLVVSCADGLLELAEVRPQAGKTQTGASFRNGRRLTQEDRFN